MAFLSKTLSPQFILIIATIRDDVIIMLFLVNDVQVSTNGIISFQYELLNSFLSFSRDDIIILIIIVINLYCFNKWNHILKL